MPPKTNMVTSQWLEDNIEQPKLIVLYTQMDNPVSGEPDSSPVGYIPNSIQQLTNITLLDARSAGRFNGTQDDGSWSEWAARIDLPVEL